MAGNKTEQPTRPSGDWLGRPILGRSKLTWEILLLTLLIALIVGTRLWDLGSRGYEHDESIHAWESWKLATGQGYVHDPVYHGPFMYHWDALIFTLFGDSDYTARLGPALFGIALALLPLLMKKWLGRRGALVTMLLIGISPVIMTRSRFIWHDVEGLFFNLLLFIAILRYLDERKPRDLYLAAAAVAFGTCIKATSEIFLAIMGVCLVLLLAWQWLQDRKRPLREFPVLDLIVVIGTLILPKGTALPIRLLGHDPLDYSSSGLVFSGIVFLAVQGVAAAVGLWWNWRRWLVCAGIFYGIFVPLYTTMFTNGRGLATGMLGMVGYWLTQQATRRGDQPWHYYLVLLPIYEYLALVAGAGAVGLYAWKGDRRERAERAESPMRVVPYMPFVIVWTVLALLAYSIAGEKMPWLTMHLALPLHLLAGWGIGRLLEADWKEIIARRGLLLLVLVPLAIYTLVSLVSGAPSTGTAVDEISRTMSWLATLIVLVIVTAAIVAVVRRLKAKDGVRMALLGVLLLLTALTVRTAWMSSFINQDYATEFLVYAAGTPDTALVTDELKDMSRRLYGDLSMKVAYDNLSSWPFVWYLRDFSNAQFYGEKPASPFDAPVVIVGIENEPGVKPFLGSNYYRREYRLIWWPHQDWYKPMTLRS
ncbi:MAG: TIGR03663 family protein, partial [Chloroflexi bacterium]|nr:TIGR03663 family protein [Chloroflexota bacterium]